jgi:hypothetical protein
MSKHVPESAFGLKLRQMDVAFRKPLTKSRILEDAGYGYNFGRRLYVNRKQKKAFSLAFLENHSEAEIEQWIQGGETHGEEWQFYFNETPTDAVRRQLADLLE